MPDRTPIAALIEQVELLQEASRHARDWTSPLSCGRAPYEMPCRHPECIERAATYAYEFAREAGHLAHQLKALLQGARLALPGEGIRPSMLANCLSIVRRMQMQVSRHYGSGPHCTCNQRDIESGLEVVGNLLRAALEAGCSRPAPEAAEG
jgi:hypothetical protein